LPGVLQLERIPSAERIAEIVVEEIFMDAFYCCQRGCLP
jgi:hypothetical protein